MRAWVALLGCAGCQIPLGMAGPQSAAVLGAGRSSLGATFEGPSLDALGLQTEERDPADPDAIPHTRPVGTTLQLAFGLSPRLDVETRLEALLPNPVPTAAVAGVRYQLLSTRRLELATSAHAGFGFGSGEDDLGRSVDVQVGRLALGASGRWAATPWLRPGVAVALTPYLFVTQRDRMASDTRVGLDGSATLAVALVAARVEVTPFATAAVFTIPGWRGASLRVFGGVTFTLR